MGFSAALVHTQAVHSVSPHCELDSVVLVIAHMGVASATVVAGDTDGRHGALHAVRSYSKYLEGSRDVSTDRCFFIYAVQVVCKNSTAVAHSAVVFADGLACKGSGTF